MRAAVRAQQRHDLRDERADLRAARPPAGTAGCARPPRARPSGAWKTSTAARSWRTGSKRAQEVADRRRRRTRRAGSRRTTSARGRTPGCRPRSAARRRGAGGAAPARVDAQDDDLPPADADPVAVAQLGRARPRSPLTRVPLRLPVSRTSSAVAVAGDHRVAARDPAVVEDEVRAPGRGRRRSGRRRASSTSRASSPSTHREVEAGLDAAPAQVARTPARRRLGRRRRARRPSAPAGGPVNSEGSVPVGEPRLHPHVGVACAAGRSRRARRDQAGQPAHDGVRGRGLRAEPLGRRARVVIGCASGSAAASGLTIRSSGGPAPSVRS